MIEFDVHCHALLIGVYNYNLVIDVIASMCLLRFGRYWTFLIFLFLFVKFKYRA